MSRLQRALEVRMCYIGPSKLAKVVGPGVTEADRSNQTKFFGTHEMADSVSTLERQNCWITMSDVFVDNEIDYRDVAASLTRDCTKMSLPLLREVFFGEVAPALASNGMTPAPEVWTGFDSDQVVEKISEMLVRRHRSWVYRVGNCLWCLICRWLCSEMWQKLESELLAIRRS